jgi:hypothetical protein
VNDIRGVIFAKILSFHIEDIDVITQKGSWAGCGWVASHSRTAWRSDRMRSEAKVASQNIIHFVVKAVPGLSGYHYGGRCRIGPCSNPMKCLSLSNILRSIGTIVDCHSEELMVRFIWYVSFDLFLLDLERCLVCLAKFSVVINISRSSVSG